MFVKINDSPLVYIHDGFVMSVLIDNGAGIGAEYRVIFNMSDGLQAESKGFKTQEEAHTWFISAFVEEEEFILMEEDEDE